MVENRNDFLRLMDELRLYTVKFEEDGTMKPKKYPSDCALESEERRLIILINHNECTFSANNDVRRAETQIGDLILRTKKQGQGIMTSEFLFLFGRLNLDSLFPEKPAEVVKKKNSIERDRSSRSV